MDGEQFDDCDVKLCMGDFNFQNLNKTNHDKLFRNSTRHTANPIRDWIEKFSKFATIYSKHGMGSKSDGLFMKLNNVK